MGLLSCQRISSVLTRIVDVIFGGEGWERRAECMDRRPLKLKQGRGTEGAVRDLITLQSTILRYG
jgi:hypothetical protein